MTSPFLSFSHLSFAWPDATPVFTDVSGSLSRGITAIVGSNGAGKSTLLRILTGELAASGGSVASSGTVRYVPQDVALKADARVDEVLGIARVRSALAAIQLGSVDGAHYDAVGDDWAVDERAAGTLASMGLPRMSLDREVGELSGGEATSLALAAALLANPDVLILDEPTNNLDASSRRRVIATLESRRGATLVVSHDRALLERVDAIGELQFGSLRWFGGAIEQYEAALAAQRETAEQTLRTAKASAGRQHRELRAHVEGAGARQRKGAKDASGMPAIVAGTLKRKAQVSDARVTAVHEDRLAQAQDRLATARDALDVPKEIRIDLPDTAVPPRRDVLLLRRCELRNGVVSSVVVQGPERIALVGNNGSGKTTLIETLVGVLVPVSGEVEVRVPVGYLPQRIDLLDDSLTVVDNVRARAQGAGPHHIREQLARFLFRGRAADALAGTLSGGERFRASLACVLLARPAPQLLLLDEPTNNLDFASRHQLIEALAGYEGALLVVSHDDDFLAQLSISRWIDASGNEVSGASR